MDAELKARWIEALKSGNYPKTKAALHRTVATGDIPAGYCCLGVLASIVGDGRWEEWHVNGMEEFHFEDCPPEVAYLPGAFCMKVGLPCVLQNDLASANDDSDTFVPVIALIEERL